MSDEITKFWSWFFYGSGNKPGYRRLINVWLLYHVVIGCVLAGLIRVEMRAAANTVLLPLAGVLIGLSFAWAGNAQALLQTTEMENLSKHRKGGFAEYVYTYQAAILCILFTLVMWGMAGLELFDNVYPTANHFKSYFAVKAVLFTFSSLTLRECWHVVMSAQLMLLARDAVRHSRKE